MQLVISASGLWADKVVRPWYMFGCCNWLQVISGSDEVLFWTNSCPPQRRTISLSLWCLHCLRDCNVHHHIIPIMLDAGTNLPIQRHFRHPQFTCRRSSAEGGITSYALLQLRNYLAYIFLLFWSKTRLHWPSVIILLHLLISSNRSLWTQ